MDWSGVRRNSSDLIDLGEPPPQLARLGDELDLLDAILGGMLEYATNPGNNTNQLGDVENSFYSDVDDNSTTNLLSSRLSDVDLNDNCNLFDDHDRLSQILNSRSENHDTNDVSLNFVDNINYNGIGDNVLLLARSPSIREPELLPSGASLRRSSRRRSQRRADSGVSTSVTNAASTASSSSQSHRRSRSTGEAVNVKAAGKRRRSSSISATGVEDDMSLKCERAAVQHAPIAVAGGSPPDWLRISMRRVRPFRLGDPSPPLTVSNSFNDSAPVFLPSAPPATDLDIVGDLGRPSSAPLVVHHNRQPQQQQQNQFESRGTLSSSRRQVGRRRQPPIGSISADNTPIHQPQQTRQNWTQQDQQQFRHCPVPDIVVVDHEERWRQHRLNSDSDDNGSDNESDGESLEHNEEIDSPSTRSHHHEQEDGHTTNPVRAYEMTNDFQSPLGQWSHGLSSLLACLGCTLGIFNISSFALYSVQFGANFILQFLIMSLVFGIPLFTLHLSLGQLLAAGTVDMWRISPIFQGIGIAILTSQAFLGVYSIIGVSWMLVYFRDSFITKQDVYRWAEPYTYRDGLRPIIYNTSKIKLEETVADYLNGVVLQRHNLEVPASSPGHLKFQVTFNLIVVWMIVFICLSKGLRSYGKVVYLFSLVPIFGMFVLSSKLLGLMPTDGRLQIITNNTIDYHRLPETDWGEFFLNTKSWMAASSVSFCTWGLLSAAAMQITSHNSGKHVLHRDASLVIIITLSVLLLSAFLANTCHQILFAHGYAYVPSSFERMSTYGFLQPIKSPPSYSGIPVRWMTHSPFLIGDRVIKPGYENFNFHRVHQQYHHLIHEHQQESGYQVLRFATELVPATLAIIGPEILSPFWSVLFYFILILFGIAQQLAIWHCLITGIMAINVKYLKSWETTITFFTCAIGFILGLPMATELGIFVVYFLDYVIGGSWWIMLLYMIEIIAVFVVRGRPYSGETVVATLFSRAGICAQTWLAPLLSFTWNVILPTLLLVLCMTIFKNGKFRYFYKWSIPNTYDYWPSWSRQLGFLFQSIPIMTVPFIAIIQTCRYLSNGPPDIFDRIQLLYRPQLESMIVNSGNSGDGIDMDRLNLDISANGQLADQGNDTNLSSSGNSGASDNLAAIINDPPPKYTPPPSYSTATGARIARMLRQSFRRSVRRIHHVFNNNPDNGTTSSSNANDNNIDSNYDIERRSQEPQNDSQLPPPPEYSTILVEMNTSTSSGNYNSGYNNSNNINFSRPNELSANQVATLLRSSFRRGMVPESISSEQLVNDVAPISQDSVIVSTTTNK